MNYLIDTNILLIYLRSSDQSRKLEKDLNLLAQGVNLVISVVSVGEIRSIAHQNNWGIRKIHRLEHYLKQFLIADINIEEVILRYAEIDAFSQGKLKDRSSNFSSRNMGKNDIWIAATSSVLNLQLITTDKDFDHLNNEYLNGCGPNLM